MIFDDDILMEITMQSFLFFILFIIQAVMGVFLLELKRGDRVAAEKVGIYPINCMNTFQIPLKLCSNSVLPKHCVARCSESGEITCRVPRHQL